MRTAIIRVTATNQINIDNDTLHVKVGDIITYQLDDIIKILEDWCKSKFFKFYAIEHNENDENKHFHIVIEFPKNSQATFNILKKKFPYGNIDTCQKGVKRCVQYLVHLNNADKCQYDWEDVITNAPQKLEEYKKNEPSSETQRVKDILNQIVTGQLRRFEVADIIESDIFMKYDRKIEKAFEYRQLKELKNTTRNINVFVMQGPAGVGKTTFCKAWAKENKKSICFSAGGNDIFGDYRGQDTMILDDINYDNFHIEDFLKMLDPNTSSTVASRYHNKLFSGDTIFICTNTSITKWFSTTDDALQEAFYRRITNVFEFKDLRAEAVNDDYAYECLNNHISVYTINKIVIDEDAYEHVYNYREIITASFKKRKLESIDNKNYEFDLKKYVDFNTNNDDDFILKQFTNL